MPAEHLDAGSWQLLYFGPQVTSSSRESYSPRPASLVLPFALSITHRSEHCLACFLSAPSGIGVFCSKWIHIASGSLFPFVPSALSVSTALICVQGSLLCDLPALLLFPTSCFSFQLNLIHSEISNLAGFEVEAIINPTNADIDLKDDLGNWGRGSASPAVRWEVMEPRI